MTVLEMVRRAIAVLTPAQAEKALAVGENIKQALTRSYRAGVKISFGTDMGVGPHGQNAREFALMVEAGMASGDAIKAATANAAELLDIADVAGSLAPGKSADIIAVNGDPLGDVTELERVTFVMARGVRATIESMSK
jgi:imidazolonepropionase-like amidohydrolase